MILLLDHLRDDDDAGKIQVIGTAENGGDRVIPIQNEPHENTVIVHRYVIYPIPETVVCGVARILVKPIVESRN